MKKPKRYSPYSSLPMSDKPLRPNRERHARRMSEGLVYGPHHQWIKRQACNLFDHPGHVCGFYEDRPRMEGHHLKTVGSGGQDRDNEIPVCPVGHDECEAAGNVSSQCARFGRDFRSIACEYTARYDAEQAEADNEP